MYIMYLLSRETLRFNELQKRMPEKITHTSLSRQLKVLEKEGLIIRKDYNQVPPKVEYSLTEIGTKFQPVLDALHIWGDDYIATLNENIK